MTNLNLTNSMLMLLSRCWEINHPNYIDEVSEIKKRYENGGDYSVPKYEYIFYHIYGMNDSCNIDKLGRFLHHNVKFDIITAKDILNYLASSYQSNLSYAYNLVYAYNASFYNADIGDVIFHKDIKKYYSEETLSKLSIKIGD